MLERQQYTVVASHNVIANEGTVMSPLGTGSNGP